MEKACLKKFDELVKYSIKSKKDKVTFYGRNVTLKQDMNEKEKIIAALKSLEADIKPEVKSRSLTNQMKDAIIRKKELSAFKAFQNLDFGCYEEVLDFFVKHEDGFIYEKSNLPIDLMIEVLAHYGYHEDDNCNENFVETDEENYAKYIIGQQIANIKRTKGPSYTMYEFSKNWHMIFRGQLPQHYVDKEKKAEKKRMEIRKSHPISELDLSDYTEYSDLTF